MAQKPKNANIDIRQSARVFDEQAFVDGVFNDDEFKTIDMTNMQDNQNYTNEVHDCYFNQCNIDEIHQLYENGDVSSHVICRNSVKHIIDSISCLPFNLGNAGLKRNQKIDKLLSYCDLLIVQGDLLSFIDELYEAIKDCYVEIGVLRPDTRTLSISWNNSPRNSMFEALKNSELLGIIGLYLKSWNVQDCVDSLVDKISTLSYYNRTMGEYFDFYDGHIAMLADCAASDLERIAEQLRV